MIYRSDAGKEMRGRKQANASAEIVRAKRPARLQDVPCQPGTGAEAAPFRDVGLNYAEHVFG